METFTRFFERILTKAYYHIIRDDISNYNEDYSHLLYFKDEEKRNFFHELSSSLSKIYLSKKLETFVMSFDNVSFCIRFKSKNEKAFILNTRLIAESLKELPTSKGNPIFLIGTTDEINSYGWKSIEDTEDDFQCYEIYPLIDFESISFYWGKKHHINSFRSYLFSQQSTSGGYSSQISSFSSEQFS